MVATDYGGDQLLRHFIEHYHALGVPYDRFLFVLHHNPAYRDDPTSSKRPPWSSLRLPDISLICCTASDMLICDGEWAAAAPPATSPSRLACRLPALNGVPQSKQLRVQVSTTASFLA